MIASAVSLAAAQREMQHLPSRSKVGFEPTTSGLWDAFTVGYEARRARWAGPPLCRGQPAVRAVLDLPPPVDEHQTPEPDDTEPDHHCGAHCGIAPIEPARRPA